MRRRKRDIGLPTWLLSVSLFIMVLSASVSFILYGTFGVWHPPLSKRRIRIVRAISSLLYFLFLFFFLFPCFSFPFLSFFWSLFNFVCFVFFYFIPLFFSIVLSFAPHQAQPGVFFFFNISPSIHNDLVILSSFASLLLHGCTVLYRYL